MIMPEYLKIHEGSRWTWEDSQYVLAHIAEVEKTYRAMIEQALGKIEAAAK